MEIQTILVTGGAGFIGTNLVNELESRSSICIRLMLHDSVYYSGVFHGANRDTAAFIDCNSEECEGNLIIWR